MNNANYSKNLQNHACDFTLPVIKYDAYPQEIIDLYEKNDAMKFLPGIRSGLSLIHI